MGSRLRTTFLLGALAGLIVALVRALARDPRPPAPATLPPPPAALPTIPRDRPEAVGEPDAARPAPAVASAGEPDAAVGPAPGDAPEAPTDTESKGTAEPDAPTVTEPAPDADPELPFAPPGGPSWMAPADGGCPEGFPIKAKESSRIFHQPGGLSYERTRPDRCYADAASAEADGFRAAKR